MALIGVLRQIDPHLTIPPHRPSHYHSILWTTGCNTALMPYTSWWEDNRLQTITWLNQQVGRVLAGGGTWKKVSQMWNYEKVPHLRQCGTNVEVWASVEKCGTNVENNPVTYDVVGCV